MSILSSGGGSPPAFTYKIVVFALAVLVMMPVFVDAYIQLNGSSSEDDQYQSEINDLMEDYTLFTGQSVANNTSVWALTGIYTPFGVAQDGTADTSAYGYTEDGWLYGARVGSYTPSQYDDTAGEYTVVYSDGFYRYSVSGTGTKTQDGHVNSDLYTSVTMDKNQKSNIFFTQSLKQTQGDNFYYEYTGFRYSFSPLVDAYIEDADGNEVLMRSSTTSLSLIWYDYYSGATTQEGQPTGSSGIAGQLVISSSDGGVSYITSERLIQAFNSATNSASFPMVFNGGVKCNVIVKIDPVKTSAGFTVEQCYQNGWWSVMVTSQTTSALAYTSTDYSFNIYNIWETFVSLFTFNLSDYYGVDDTSGFVMSLIMSICMYAGLLAIGLSCYPVLIFAGILAVVQTAFSVGDTSAVSTAIRMIIDSMRGLI